MTTIVLGGDRVWHLGAQIGKGGFGRVCEARSDAGSEAVVKLIPKSPGADRELLFEKLTGVPNVIPVIDTGEYKNNWVLVMPRADKSLRQHMAECGGVLAADEAVAIITDVAMALAALAVDVVHRDVKPDNVLLFDGSWFSADLLATQHQARGRSCGGT